MPSLFCLRLHAQRETLLPSNSAPAQGWFLALMGRIDPEAADAMHVPDKPRRYTVAPFHFPTLLELRRDGHGTEPLDCPQKVGGGKEVVLRVGLADEVLARRVLRALQAGVELPRFAGAECQLSHVPDVRDPQERDYWEIPWATLATTPPTSVLHLAFVTPTFFSSQGEDLLFPEPRRLWESWRRSWETWTDLPLPDIQPEGKLRVAGYRLQTRNLRIKGGLQRGFVGELDLEWTAKASAEEKQVLAALAGLANLAGTGARTSLGLGQTRTSLRSEAQAP